VAELERKLDFLFDEQRGFMATCPSNLGTGMRASVHIKIPHASKDPRFKAICEELHLQPRGADGEHSTADGGLFDISPLKRLGLTEVQCAQALHEGAVRLIALEKELRG
jgi:protein-arginine kinase